MLMAMVILEADGVLIDATVDGLVLTYIFKGKKRLNFVQWISNDESVSLISWEPVAFEEVVHRFQPVLHRGASCFQSAQPIRSVVFRLGTR